MAKTGIAANTWQDTQAMSGFAPPPALRGYMAEIIEIKEGVSEKDGSEYMMPMMKLGHEDLIDDVKHGEYFSLTDDRVGFLKGFLLAIGRADLMRGGDADWEELIGTQFECDIRRTTGKNGNVYANIITQTINPISHQIFEVPMQEPEAPKVAPAAAAATGRVAPRRSPRGGAVR